VVGWGSAGHVDFRSDDVVAIERIDD
jgi:hypothetical protein